MFRKDVRMDRVARNAGSAGIPSRINTTKTMKVCIRRGAEQIGGNCIEIECQGKRIVLDIGLPLGIQDSQEAKMPDVPGLEKADDSLLGIVLSHTHPDHYGLAFRVPESVNFLMGEASERILATAALFTRSGGIFRKVIHLADRIPIPLGPFTITPFLMDHSAYDSYAVLIEAEGKRLFYTGDLRGHGRKSSLFEKLVAHPPQNVDVLLMEGTNLQKEGSKGDFKTERELEEELVSIFQETTGMPLVWCSGQNIDRIVTIFRAAKRSGRRLIVDMYTAEVLRATGNPKIPQAEWKEVRVYLPWSQKEWIKQTRNYAISNKYRGFRIFPEDLAGGTNRSVMIFRPSMRHELAAAECLEGACLVYSMWNGYLEEVGMEPFLRWLEEHHLPMYQCHTSGHASLNDLKRLRNAFKLARVVPVHCACPEVFAGKFDRVERHPDNEIWEVRKMNEESSENKKLNGLRPDRSLHQVKDLLRLKYAEEQARFLVKHLDPLLEATANVAPVRQPGHGYPLNRDVPVRRLNKSPKTRDRWMEKHWEEASFLKWRGSDTGLESSVVFRRLVAYQVMLRETNEDKGWGEIDLLGMDRQSLPVVVELKSKPGETLLRAITEAVAYGVAIKKAWNAEPSQFREDWKSAVDPQVCDRKKITNIHSVIAAPTSYWSTVLNPSQKRTRYQTRPEVIKVIRLLLKELSERGHKISLVEITHEEFEDKYGLPILTDAKTVEMTE